MSAGVKAILRNAVFGLLVAAGLFCSLLVITFSWVKVFSIAFILVAGTLWLLTPGRFKRTFKYVAIGALIFAIAFSSFENYLLFNAGYPSAKDAEKASTAYTDLFDISLTQLIQSIEKSPTYALLTAEHGKTNPETIKLDSSSFPDLIEVDFYGSGSNAYLGFIAPNPGDEYHVQVSTYSGEPFSLTYVKSSSTQAFSQIDSRGLQWYYNRALELAQNRTSTPTKIDSLSLTMSVEDRIYMSYEGITVQIIGSYQGQSTLICDFEPDGTLIYMSLPPAT